MIILANTTDNLQIVLGGTVTANQLNIVTSWRDVTTTAYTPGRTLTNSNNTTDVNIVPAPAASTQRVVDFISVYNADTADATVTIKFDANGTEYIIYKDVLGTGDTLRFIEGAGFSTERTYQPVKTISVHADAGANFVMTNATLAERFAGNSTRMIFGIDLLGYTQVKLEGNKQVIGTAGSLFRAKYFTSFNTTVTNYLQLGASAQVEFSMAATGYANTGWVNMAAGAQANGIYIALTELGGDGVADPALGFTEINFR
jgi:hypothetical protein